MFVLHADADSFFASVEQRDDPRLRGRPVIVGGGVVLAASYEAKAYGIRTAMGGRQARRLCPDAIVVPPRHTAYLEASRAMFAVFEDASPVVEGLSIDEAFLDVRGMERIAGTPVEIAVRLRAAVRDRVGLPVTVGIARTKFLAKVASGVAKPDGLIAVAPDRELAFLHPLPVECVWGVGPGTARRLHAWNVRTVDAPLVGIVDRIARRLRAAGRVGRTVVLRLRFGDFERATRSHTLPFATANTQAVLITARALLATATPLIEQRGITLVGCSVAMLEDARTRQLLLGPEEAVDAAVDAIRDRYGSAAITRAVLLGRDPGFSMPLLPD